MRFVLVSLAAIVAVVFAGGHKGPGMMGKMKGRYMKCGPEKGALATFDRVIWKVSSALLHCGFPKETYFRNKGT